MIFTGQLNAASKLNPTHPRPRLCGSDTGRPRMTGPGYPMDTALYVQPAASLLTRETIRLGVNIGPESTCRCVVSPVTRILTCVPPTSTTRTFIRGSTYPAFLNCALLDTITSI